MFFHWYLFAFLFILYCVARAGNQQYSVYVAGEYEARYRWFTAVAVIAVLTYVAAKRDLFFQDTSAYTASYMTTEGSWENVVRTFRSEGKDRGFYTTVVLLKMLLKDNYRAYFGVIAGFCLLCVIGVYRKHSCNFFMTVFLFLASGEYVQWTHNGMRQFIAVAMTFAATDLLLRKRYLLYIAAVLIASTFHASALMMLPMCFVVRGPAWNYKSVLMILAVVVAATSSDFLMGMVTDIMESTQYAGDVNNMMTTDGTNAIRVLVFAVPPMMALIFLRRIRALDVPLINLSVNMSVASLGIYIVSMFTSGIYIGRLPVYCSLYNYILLPWVLERTFEKGSAKIIMLMAMGCYMVFYYYQMHIIWGL